MSFPFISETFKYVFAHLDWAAKVVSGDLNLLLASIYFLFFIQTPSLLSILKQELAVGESFAWLKALLFVLDMSLVVKKLLHVFHLSMLACLICFHIELSLVSILQSNEIPHRHWSLLSWKTIRRIGSSWRWVIFLRIGDLQFTQRAKQALFYWVCCRKSLIQALPCLITAGPLVDIEPSPLSLGSCNRRLRLNDIFEFQIRKISLANILSDASRRLRLTSGELPHFSTLWPSPISYLHGLVQVGTYHSLRSQRFGSPTLSLCELPLRRVSCLRWFDILDGLRIADILCWLSINL